MAVALQAGQTVMGVINDLKENYKDNGDVLEFLNNHQDRDQRARMEGTYKHGRFSRERQIMGIPSGRWYCCYSRQGAQKRKIPLDR